MPSLIIFRNDIAADAGWGYCDPKCYSEDMYDKDLQVMGWFYFQ